jgi:methylmalonyl-CoA/ethylmalonyl-CoA epimerase
VEDTKSTVHLHEIAQIALTVQNLEEAKTFYRDTLGMHFLFDAGTMAFFQCGPIRLMIGTSDQPSSSNGTIVYFRVPDLPSTFTELTSKDVAFVQDPHLAARMKSHDLWLAFLKDPAGNTLGLMSEVVRIADQPASA